MADILSEIEEKTRTDLKKRVREISLSELRNFPQYEKTRLDFKEAILDADSISIIAEIKKASPSKGEIRPDFDPAEIAKSYIDNRVSAISVLTDQPFFKGDLKYLEIISEFSPVPLLRKDFILDPYQVKEARAFGADAVLLIATMYSGTQLSELLAAAKEFGLQALVECYHKEEVDALPWNSIDILGVNNRDLKTFDVDLHRGVKLLQTASEHVATVSESGIHKPEDLVILKDHGIHAALIGEHFMRQQNPGLAVRQLLEEFEKTIEK
jgi:indole-3-glycerol phosphate synthase